VGRAVDAASEARVMDFFVVGVGLVLCACMAAVSGAIAEFAAASADGYDAAVSAVRSHLQERGQEEKAAQPPA
jgi:hypothetical protein